MRIETHVQTLPDLLNIGTQGMMKETEIRKKEVDGKEPVSKYCSTVTDVIVKKMLGRL